MPKYPALNHAIIEAALEGLEAQKQRVDGQLAEVRQLLGRRGPGRPPGGQTAQASPAPRKRRKRKLSPEGRAAIVAAAKKRWAAIKKQKAAQAKKAES